MDIIKENIDGQLKNKMPISWKCESINITMEELEKIPPKFFVPYGGSFGDGSHDTCKINNF